MNRIATTSSYLVPHAEAGYRFTVGAFYGNPLGWRRICGSPVGRSRWRTLEHARREFSGAFELDCLEVLKKHSGGVKARAASWAGVSRQAIHKLARKHDLDSRPADLGSHNSSPPSAAQYTVARV